MPRAEAALPGGPRLSDIMGVSLLAAAYPTDRVRQVLREMGADRQCERVIDFRLKGEGAPEDASLRLLTTILDHEAAPAGDLAELYLQRWEIETTLDEFKTYLRGGGIVLRSKTPQGVYQEFWGFVLAHHALHTVMHDAALKVDV